MTRVRESQVSISVLVEAVDGGQYRRAERLAAELSISSHPVLPILCADIEIYFARLGRAAELLDQARANLEEIRVAARYSLTRGQLLYWRGEHDESEELFQTACHIYRLMGDSFYLASSLLNLARVRQSKTDYAGAEKLLGNARELLRAEGPKHIERFEFLSGLIDFYAAICRRAIGDLDSASLLYGSAIELLRRSEEGRFYGLALSSYGSLIVSVGRYREALEPLQQANRIFARLALWEDLNQSRRSLAAALSRLKRYEEAEALLSECIELTQRLGDVAADPGYLIDFAELNLLKGDWERARVYAQQAIEQADLSQNITYQTSARIVAGRVFLATGNGGNAEQQLNASLELARKSGQPHLEALARLYLSEALVPTSAITGREHLNRATELLARYRDAAVDQDLKRISNRYRGERITITADNKLVINGHLLPTWNAAKEAVERFLLKNALEQSQDNQTKAGQVLAITKVHVHDKRKQYGL